MISSSDWYRGDTTATSAATGLLTGRQPHVVLQRQGRPTQTAVLLLHFLFKVTAVIIYLLGGMAGLGYIGTVTSVLMLLR